MGHALHDRTTYDIGYDAGHGVGHSRGHRDGYEQGLAEGRAIRESHRRVLIAAGLCIGVALSVICVLIAQAVS